MSIQDFIKKRKHLIWWVTDFSKITPESVVEATLNYGDWDDVQTLIKVLGIKKVAKIFREKSTPSKIGRQNYSDKTKYFFKLYFNEHA